MLLYSILRLSPGHSTSLLALEPAQTVYTHPEGLPLAAYSSVSYPYVLAPLKLSAQHRCLD